jgi:hypothetical protein
MFIVYCQYGEVWQFCYYHVKFECAFNVQNEMLCTKHITGLFPREQFSNSVVWSGILYLTTQHYRKTVPSGENNNGTMLLDFVFKNIYAS